MRSVQQRSSDGPDATTARLPLNGIDRYKPHNGERHSFTDRLGICGIVLIGLHVGLYKFRGHEPNAVTEAL